MFNKFTVYSSMYFLLLFKYSCLNFFPTRHPTHNPSLPPTLEPTPFGIVRVSFIHVPIWPFPYFPPLSLFPLPLWLLSVCFLFQCLWLYFACLFVLLIRFHLHVRSYGICILPPDLFHLA